MLGLSRIFFYVHRVWCKTRRQSKEEGEKKKVTQNTILIIFRVLFVTDVFIVIHSVCMVALLFLLLLLHMAMQTVHEHGMHVALAF